MHFISLYVKPNLLTMTNLNTGAKLLLLIDLKTEVSLEKLLMRQSLVLNLISLEDLDEDSKAFLKRQFLTIYEALKRVSFFSYLSLQTLIYERKMFNPKIYLIMKPTTKKRIIKNVTGIITEEVIETVLTNKTLTGSISVDLKWEIRDNSGTVQTKSFTGTVKLNDVSARTTHRDLHYQPQSASQSASQQADPSASDPNFEVPK